MTTIHTVDQLKMDYSAKKDPQLTTVFLNKNLVAQYYTFLYYFSYNLSYKT